MDKALPFEVIVITIFILAIITALGIFLVNKGKK